MKHVNSALEDAFSGNPRLKTLSSREAEVMEYVIQGYANKEIAVAVGLATGTIDIYITAVRAKLHVVGKNRDALIAAYLATRDP